VEMRGISAAGKIYFRTAFPVVLLIRPQAKMNYDATRSPANIEAERSILGAVLLANAARRVFLLPPQAIPHLHTIYTARFVFSIAITKSHSAFFRSQPTNFIKCDAEFSIFSWTLTISARSHYFKQS
jgi:hypothetical protein